MYTQVYCMYTILWENMKNDNEISHLSASFLHSPKQQQWKKSLKKKRLLSWSNCADTHQYNIFYNMKIKGCHLLPQCESYTKCSFTQPQVQFYS